MNAISRFDTISFDKYINKDHCMNLNKNCKHCNIQLTLENVRKRKEVPSGFRNECRSCHNSFERKRINVPKKICEGCGILCWAKGTKYFCSTECRFKWSYTINLITGCWEWIKHKDVEGYGRFMANKIRGRAHRFSYEFYKGPINTGMFVCHTCDNTSCVNPDHLWEGDNQQNQIDSVKKGRSAGVKNFLRKDSLV